MSRGSSAADNYRSLWVPRGLANRPCWTCWQVTRKSVRLRVLIWLLPRPTTAGETSIVALLLTAIDKSVRRHRSLVPLGDPVDRLHCSIIACLFRRSKGVEGNIRIGNRVDRKANRKICSYILQEDNLFPWFTVIESMTLAANLKIGRKSHTYRQFMVSRRRIRREGQSWTVDFMNSCKSFR